MTEADIPVGSTKQVVSLAIVAAEGSAFCGHCQEATWQASRISALQMSSDCHFCWEHLSKIKPDFLVPLSELQKAPF